MEAVGLVIGLPGLINDCLDLWERFDHYRNFDQASKIAATVFATQKLRFSKWVRLVGFGDGELLSVHDARLDDPETIAVIKEVILRLKSIFESHSGKILDQPTAGNIKVSSTMRKASKRLAAHWAFSGRTKTMNSMDQIEMLVSALYEIVPPEDEGGSGSLLTTPLQNRLDDLLDHYAQASHAHNQGAVMKFVDPPTTFFDFETHVASRAADTSEWIFSHDSYIAWSSANEPAILWIAGSAGHGKTMLCSRLLLELVASHRTKVFHVFAAGHASHGGRLDGVPRAWLAQAAHHHPDVMLLIRHQIRTSTQEQATLAIVWRCLVEAASLIGGCVFVLDGLDEYPGVHDSRMIFLEQLKGLLTSARSRALIVSRREADIQLVMDHFDAEATPLIFACNLHASIIQIDIKLYASEVVNKKLGKHDPTFRDDIAEQMAQKCNGMFLWIKMHQDQLRSGKNKKYLLRTVQETPSGLETTYDRNIAQMLKLPRDDKQRGASIIRWLLLSKQPLTVKGLIEATEISLAVLDSDKVGDLIDS